MPAWAELGPIQPQLVVGFYFVVIVVDNDVVVVLVVVANHIVKKTNFNATVESYIK